MVECSHGSIWSVNHGRRKMAPREVQEGRSRVYELVLYPRVGGRQPFREVDRATMVTTECNGDSLCGLSPEHQKQVEWDQTWLASVTDKARDVGRPPGASSEWQRRRLKGCQRCRRFTSPGDSGGEETTGMECHGYVINYG
jgi:hypothetical protein